MTITEQVTKQGQAGFSCQIELKRFAKFIHSIAFKGMPRLPVSVPLDKPIGENMRYLQILLILFTIHIIHDVALADYAEYHQLYKKHYSNAVAEEPKFESDMPTKPAIIVSSGGEISRAILIRTDGTKVPYEKETAHIKIESELTEPFYIVCKFFRTIKVEWVTNRVIVIYRNIGHVADIEEIYDIVDRKWLSQQSVTWHKK